MAIYQKIFSPLTVRNMTIKNRISMMPMGSNMGGQYGEITDNHIKYYEERAKGGTGLIIVENACIDAPQGLNGTTQICIDHDRYITNLSKLTETLHNYNAAVSLQINHAGFSALSERTGCKSVSSSEYYNKKNGSVSSSLTNYEISQIAQKYGQAAQRAVIAGFDCVEVHCGHSYLINQFLSTIYNKRTDKFGGSTENRARFPRMVLQSVRKAVGICFPICIRINADDLMESGNKLEDIFELLIYLDEFVDIYNVSIGVNEKQHYHIDLMQFDDGWRSHYAKSIRDRFKKITITSGNIRDPKVAETLLEKGYADIIGMGRGLIADPQWVNKVANNNEDLIRKCISCNIGCAGNRLAYNRMLHCTINPDLFNNDEYKKYKVNSQTNVVVIGGGTAGLEAACTAAEVGCTVFLIEKNKNVGGLSRQISMFPNKRRIYDFPQYLEHRASTLDNLYMITNKKADLETIKFFKPHIIINATGSQPLLPKIPGLLEQVDGINGKVFSIFGLFEIMPKFKDLKDKVVAVVGGGAVGLDVADYFAECNAHVTIFEMMSSVGKDLDPIAKLAMQESIVHYNIRILTESKLCEVKDECFIFENKNGIQKFNFDYGVICLGMKSFNELDEILRVYSLDKGVSYVNIGDSKRPRKMIDGVQEGRNILTILRQIGRI